MSDEDSSGDERVIYHDLFQEAQSAIQNSEANQRKSRAVRAELEAYLDSASERKGSDGNALIRIPSNFDTIVKSMNREDLSVDSSDDKPWSQYLLLDGLNAEDDKEYNGRYSHSFHDTPEAKIQRGLAQIQLLDRQLQDVTKKISPLTSGVDVSTDDSVVDTTFLTNTHGQKGLKSDREVSVKLGNQTKMESAKFRGKHDALKQQENKRLEWLLDTALDDGLRGINSYLEPELEAESKAVDQKLAEFGRWDLLAMDDSGSSSQQQPSHSGERRPDYLDELRSARAEKEREAHLNSLIDICTNHPIMYEALLPPVPTSGQKVQLENASSSEGGRVSSTGGMGGRVGDLPVPDPGQVQPEKAVTFEDIQQLISMLSDGINDSPAGFPANQVTRSFAVSPSPTPSTSANSRASQVHGLLQHPVNREGIETLVRRYRKEIEALGRVRAGHSRVTVHEVETSERAAVLEARLPTSELIRRQVSSSKPVDTEQPNQQGGWLDLKEEVPVAMLNMTHSAVRPAAAPGRAVVTHSSSRPKTAEERLPPIPPSGQCGDESVQWSHNKRQSVLDDADLTAERQRADDAAYVLITAERMRKEDETNSPTRPIKSLRLPPGVLNAQLPNSHGVSTTVFRAVNARLVSDTAMELNVKIANGARLAKKIGAALSASAHQPHSREAIGSRQPTPHSEVSPNSARRALKAGNVLSSMTSSSKAQSDSMRI